MRKHQEGWSHHFHLAARRGRNACGRRPAAECARLRASNPLMSTARRLASLACWTPVAIAGADVLGRPASVRDARMGPALSPGDVTAVDRLSCRLYRFRRGEVVVLK